MAVTREVHKVIVDEGGLVFLELDWDYNDAIPQGQKLYGWRVVNGSQLNLVYRAAFYLDSVLQWEREVVPGEDTGRVILPSPLNLMRGTSFRAFNPLLQRWRYAS